MCNTFVSEIRSIQFLLCGEPHFRLPFIFSCRLSELYCNIEDDELDGAVQEILSYHPNSGYKMMLGYLNAQGIHIPSKSTHEPMAAYTNTNCSCIYHSIGNK